MEDGQWNRQRVQFPHLLSFARSGSRAFIYCGFETSIKMHNKPGQKDPSVLVKFVSAGLAASVAEACTIPIDTAKVRLQVSEF